MFSEIEVEHTVPIPAGYRFLPKGNSYKTLHCRKATRKASRKLYIVKKQKKPIGIRVPAFILDKVHEQAQSTLAARQAATAERDNAEQAKIAAEMNELFPQMPENDRERVLKYGFQKYSGRVGRSTTLPLYEKVIRAVVAHIRHNHTLYENLLLIGSGRSAARRETYDSIHQTMRNWGFIERMYRNPLQHCMSLISQQACMSWIHVRSSQSLRLA